MRCRRGLSLPFVWSWIVLIHYASGSVEHDQFVDDLMQAYNSQGSAVPGASVLVMHKGVPVLRRSYGSASLEEQTPVTYATNFRLASVTKQFTAAAILLLAEDPTSGLQLDDRIREKWLPALPEVAKAMTIRQLLSHTTGLIDYEELTTASADPDYQLSDADVLTMVSTQNRTYFAPPGSRYRYSNTGYALLALIVERASGQRFAEFLRERIFRPLHMNNTAAFEKGISTVAHRAFGYSKREQVWVKTDQSQTSAVLGDGGIYSSIDDLAKWDAALYDNRLLSSESLKLAFTPIAQTDDPGNRYGLGWYISGDMVWHSGETIGFRNVMLRFPTQRMTVIVLTNRYSPGPYQTALVIAHRMLFTTDCAASSSSKSTAASRLLQLLACYLILSARFVR